MDLPLSPFERDLPEGCMRAHFVFAAGLLVLVGCTGGAAGVPADDVGTIYVLSHSPGNGDEVDTADSVNGFNALDNVTLLRRPGVAVIFSGSLDLTSVINNDPADPQGSRNIRLFYFDTTQGPFDPTQPTVLGVNPPGANVIVPATTVPDTFNPKTPNDMLVITPTGISASSPLREGQYSVIIQQGVRGADGDGMKGQEYFFFFRVGQDQLGPVVVKTSPLAGEKNVAPDAEIRITMSETVLASTVNSSTIKVEFQPAGAAAPTPIPGFFYTDGGNGPGNNYPNIQLDAQGLAGRTGVSPRNGVDLVFRPDLTAFPVNMTADDPLDFTNNPPCNVPAGAGLRTDPPRKGNRGYPLGRTITVRFETVGTGVTDTAGNPIPAGSPSTTFTFETKPAPEPLYAPDVTGAIYYGDTVGVGVIDVDPSRSPYLVGPNPPRQPNTVLAIGTGPAAKVVRVAVPDLVDMTTDTRPYSAFFTLFDCVNPPPAPNLAMPVLYAASGSTGGGQIVVIDTFNMVPMGRFGTPSPGGVALTAYGGTVGNGRLVVSNFSANTVTVYDISQVRWFRGPSIYPPYPQQGVLGAAVTAGIATLLLTEDDFKALFPHQRMDASSPPGPPIIGTIKVGVSPGHVRITGLPGSLGSPGNPCYSPYLTSNPIVCALNVGANTADFTELQRLNQSEAIEPDLPGVNLSSKPTDVAWAPWSVRPGYPTSTGSYYFFITGVGGSVELFASGYLSNTASVRQGSASNFAPNKIINSITGLDLPSSVQWIPGGTGAFQYVSGYTFSAIVCETGKNRLVEVDVTSEFPTNLFQVTNPDLLAGLGPVDVAGDPVSAIPFVPCGPYFSTYYVANAGQGTVSTGSYLGGVIATDIAVPGVVLVCSWWSR
jgi:hypothetical protein